MPCPYARFIGSAGSPRPPAMLTPHPDPLPTGERVQGFWERNGFRGS
jgi:hypothetical protein